MKKFLLAALAGVMFQAAGAQTFESGGLKYQVTDATEWTVTLTGPVDKEITTLDIPATVPYHRQTADNRTETITCTVTAIGYNAFYECKSLTTVKMAGTVTKIEGRAFQRCAALESLELSDNIASIGEFAFSSCSVLESVEFPPALKTIGRDAFENCSMLRIVTLNEGLESIGESAFAGNNAMLSLTFPSTLKSIGGSAFYRCNVLRKVTFNGAVASVGFRAFDYSFALKEVHCKDIESWCGMGFSESTGNPLTIAHKLYIGGEEVTDLVIPATVETIAPYAFHTLETLKSVVISDGVKKIGRNAFSSTPALESVDFGNTLEHIDTSAFNSSAIKSAHFPNTVKILGNTAFERCEALESVSWSSGMELVGEGAFSYNSALAQVDISDLAAWCRVDFKNNSNPLRFAGRFTLNGEDILDLVIPDGITEILPNTFEGGGSFKSVKIPDGVKSIGYHSFWGCTSIRSLYIGTGLNQLDLYKFGGSSEITKLYIADGDSHITIVSDDGWANGWAIPKKISELYIGRDFTVSGTLAPNVQLLTFGPQVTDAQANDYTKYTGLLMLTDLSSTPPELYEFTEEQYANVVVKVPEGAVDAYRAADYWKKFALVTDSPDYDVENISIAFDADSYTIFPSAFKASDLSYTVTPEIFQALPVEYLSSDETLLTFSGLKPETHGYGDVTVTARLLTNGATATAEAKTYAAPDSIALTCGGELTLHVGETYQFEVTSEPSPIVPEMLRWYSPSPSWLKLDENGLATALRKTSSGVKVQVSTYNSKRAECLVNIVDAETGVGEMEAVAPDAVYDVYTPAGALLLREAGTSRLESLPRGIYILRNADTTVKYVR